MRRIDPYDYPKKGYVYGKVRKKGFKVIIIDCDEVPLMPLILRHKYNKWIKTHEAEELRLQLKQFIVDWLYKYDDCMISRLELTQDLYSFIENTNYVPVSSIPTLRFNVENQVNEVNLEYEEREL